MSDARASRRPVRAPPSLTRRVLVTVFVAVLAVFALVLALLMAQALARESGELDRSLLRSAQTLARMLGHVDADGDPHVARALFDEIETQRREARPEDGPQVRLVALRRDGTLRMASDPLPALDLAGLPAGVEQRTLAEREVRFYTADTGRWRVTLIDDTALRREAVLRSTLRDLALYLSFALPVILLPVWLAVRTALKPLRRLSDDVAARAPGDMSPIQLPRTYRELLPLQAALNRLFERVSAGFAREKAFVHDAAHELRTPLAVIEAQAHVLQSAGAPERAEAARRLHGAVERASHLAQQLLGLAQADALALAPRQELDVMDLARDTLSGFAAQAAAQDGELSLAGPDHLRLATDPRALRSMLCNLVDNALRYGGRGVAVEVQVEHDPGTWTLRVADDGPGIPPEHRAQAFERFWRGKAEDQRGAGLGLAIVREAARSLGGEVALQAGPAGRGCVFSVVLPRR